MSARSRWLAGSLGLTLVLGCGGAMDQMQDPPHADTLKIGMVFSMSGVYGGFGRGVENGARLAIAEINEAGGIHGKFLELRVANDKSTPALGVIGARDLEAEGAVGLIGGSSSSVTLAMAREVTIAAGLPVVSASSTSPALSTLVDNDTVWRTAPSDAFQGRILADGMLAQGLRKMAVVYVDNAYGAGLAQAFRERFVAQGGTVTASVSYPDGKVVAFSTEVENLLRPVMPDGVLAVGYLGDTANFLQDLALANPQPKPRIFGVDANYDQSFLLNAPASMIEGMEGTAPAAPAGSPGYQAFAARMRARLGVDPILYADGAYDAVYLMALAMTAGGSPTRQAIVANLRGVSGPSGQPGDLKVGPGQFAEARAALQAGRHVDYDGASGPIDFDPNGDVTSGTYIWWRIVRGTDGKLAYVTDRVVAFP